MDAISFVLGIKSSHLRSTHLRDLIYRGRILKTSKINADGTATEVNEAEDAAAADDDDADNESQSQSQRNDPTTAWVMAVYEDDGGDEHLWKRTITSAGASEYRINNRVVNAKQYNEALEAENILIKARNFLVFQGDVEAIASQSPKDLTRLVEQISGSLEYKAEYDKLADESEKAAEEQTEKLTQRRAINAEIKQFSQQKDEVVSFQRKQDERDEAVIEHVLWKLYHFQQVIEESTSEIKKHQEEMKEHRRELEKYEQQLESSKRDQAKVGRDVSKAERNIKTAEKTIEDKQNALVPVDEKITISNRNLDKYKKRVADIGKEKDGQAQTVDQLKADLTKVQKAQTKWEEEWNRRNQSQGRQLTGADLQEYNRLRVQVNTRTATAQIELDTSSRQSKTEEETLNTLQSKIDEHERQYARLEESINGLKENRETAEAQLRQSTSELAAKKKEHNTLTSERLKRAQKHTELDEKLNEVARKLLEADDGRRQTEKEARARETVAALKRHYPGVRGRVHELCKPKQKKYETAISTALGRHFDALVVDSDKTAKECISYLREQRLGQATFIPLDSIQVKNAASNLKSIHAKARLAVDTIEYDHTLERAMSYACGNTLICDDLETAKTLVYERRIDAKAVTLDGIVIAKAGNMTGGRGPNDRNGRKWEDAEIEPLRRMKDKLKADLEALPSTHESVAAEEALQGEMTGLEQRINYYQEEVQALDRNLEGKQKEFDFVQRQLSELRPKHRNQARNVETLQTRINARRDEIGQVEDEVFAAFCNRLGYADIRAYEAQQGTFQQEGAQKKLEFNIQKGKLENQLTFETQRLQATNDRISTIEAQSQRDRDLIDSLEAEKEAMQAELDELQTKVTALHAKLDDVKAKYAEKADKVAEHRREYQKSTKNVDQDQKSITGLEAEVQRNAGGRHALLRRCKIEEISIPLTEDSASIDTLPADVMQGNDPDAMDLDDEEDTQAIRDAAQAAVDDFGIIIDFTNLADDLKEDSTTQTETELQAKITALTTELSSLSPNMRSVERLTAAQAKLAATTAAFQAARDAAKETADNFDTVRVKRADLFNKAFTHISAQIAPVYKALTRSAQFPLGGQAYLTPTGVDTTGAGGAGNTYNDDETPFLGGIKYHAMPPLKRFRDMDALSGGEKTIAALALLFAIHSFAPSPFFVLDEVDAALDNANVAKVARYIRENKGPGMQFIVISLKTGLFQESETLVGVLRDQGINSSRAVTLDVSGSFVLLVKLNVMLMIHSCGSIRLHERRELMIVACVCSVRWRSSKVWAQG